jgi:hypothetical protein
VSGQTDRPLFKPARAGVEAFDDESDFHASTFMSRATINPGMDRSSRRRATRQPL